MSLQADNIICCLLRQMVLTQPAGNFQHSETRLESRAAAVDHAKRLLCHDQQYFIILDGIDDLKEYQMNQVLEFLRELFLNGNICVKAFITNRPSTHSQTQDWIKRKRLKSSLLDLESAQVMPHVADDIIAYIDATLTGLLDEERPDFLGQASLILEIRDVLEKKANGM